MRPIGIDLFSGAGGLSLGFEQAGFDIVSAVDIDPVHCAVHHFNFPDTAVIPRSVDNLSAAEIRDAAANRRTGRRLRVRRRALPGFLPDRPSRAGRPAQRVGASLRAPGGGIAAQDLCIRKRQGPYGRQAQIVSRRTGGRIRRHWVRGTVALEGAQCRELRHAAVARTLVRSWRARWRANPGYPEPTTGIAGHQRDLVGLPDSPTCRDALGDLPNADRYPELLQDDETETSAFDKPSAYASEMRCLSNSAWHFGYVRNWERAILTSSARTRHTEISQRRFAETQPGTVEPISRFFKLHENGVSNTLRAGTDGARGAFTSPRPIHYGYDRCITVREMARLHGFPDWFRLHATKWHGARQIGNAVPPPLARAIAAEVAKSLEITPVRPRGTIELGDPGLLKLDISGAAAYFDVDPLPNKRDRKSGAKKRRQVDIEAERLAAVGAHG